MAKDSEPPAEVCPVSPADRAAWLKSRNTTTFSDATSEAAKASHGSSCDSDTIEQTQTPPPQPKGLLSRLFGSSNPPLAEPVAPTGLGTQRVISTIPRASEVDDAPDAKPANSEKESGTSASGNWIYPSEKMFFDAMKRKGFKSEVADMQTIVPLHNAINEQAWKEIKEWEKPWGADEKYVHRVAQVLDVRF
jgi:cytochrome c heme-lyase